MNFHDLKTDDRVESKTSDDDDEGTIAAKLFIPKSGKTGGGREGEIVAKAKGR